MPEPVAAPTRPEPRIQTQPQYSPKPSRPGYAQYALQPGDRVVPMSPVRRVIAEHMVYSKRTSPHVGYCGRSRHDCCGSLAAGAQDRPFSDTYGFSLTYLPFIVHAVVRALREFPALNASVMEDAIVEKRAIHIGLAAETDRGLVVPVLRNADRLSLGGLAAEIEDLVTRAQEPDN